MCPYEHFAKASPLCKGRVLKLSFVIKVLMPKGVRREAAALTEQAWEGRGSVWH